MADLRASSGGEIGSVVVVVVVDITHHITLLDWASIITISKLTRRTLLANVLIFVPLQVPYSMHYAAPNIHHV